MVDLAKMDRQQQDEIRGHQSYKKILDACKQAQTDGYEWMWVDTCCIDKRSSAELSEAVIQCISGMETPKYAMRTSATLKAPPFPQRKMMESITSRMDGRSGFRVGGHYRRW